MQGNPKLPGQPVSSLVGHVLRMYNLPSVDQSENIEEIVLSVLKNRNHNTTTFLGIHKDKIRLAAPPSAAALLRFDLRSLQKEISVALSIDISRIDITVKS